MKVHATAPTRLEIRHRPVFWAVVFGCILFVLAGWGVAGLLEGESMGATFALSLGAVMAWLVFREILTSFSLVLDRDANRIIYNDTKRVLLNAPVALFSGEVERAALLIAIGGGTGYVWLEKALVRLDLTFDPADGVIRMTRSNMLGTTKWLPPLRHFDGAELIEKPVELLWLPPVVQEFSDPMRV